MKVLHIGFLITYMLINIISGTYYEPLRFTKDKEFTIIQFTDLHYGESSGGDYNSTKLQEKLIGLVNPDMAIITGDSVSGYSWDGLNTTFYADCWNLWTRPMKTLKIPYAYTLGNHDDQGNFNRKQICDLDATHEFSLSQYNSNATGATNYFVPILSSNSSNPAVILWMFDTNDETCQGVSNSWGCFEKDEVNWYEEETKRINSTLGYLPQGLAFFHIPIEEYKSQFNWKNSYNSRNEGISCPKRNTGLFKKMLEFGNIEATFCGHDHDNDNGGKLYGIDLVYNRKTGYGGYGPSYFQRGARVLKLKEVYDPIKNRMVIIYRHYVVQQDGTIVENGEHVWKGWYDYVDGCSR